MVPSVKSTLGQAKAGPEIGYRIVLGHAVIVPHAGVQLIWNFAGETTIAGQGALTGENFGPQGVRGRVELGLRATTTEGIGLDAAGSYDGIGANGDHALTGKVIVRVPLN